MEVGSIENSKVYETVEDHEPRPPATIALSALQKGSIAELRPQQKHALYENVCRGDLENYFRVSCRPITKKAEDDMELLSDIVTWGERYLHHWEQGVYLCSRCHYPLYQSQDKYKGPCVWPSFRESIHPEAISTVEVSPLYSSLSLVHY